MLPSTKLEGVAGTSQAVFGIHGCQATVETNDERWNVTEKDGRCLTVRPDGRRLNRAGWIMFENDGIQVEHDEAWCLAPSERVTHQNDTSTSRQKD